MSSKVEKQIAVKASFIKEMFGFLIQMLLFVVNCSSICPRYKLRLHDSDTTITYWSSFLLICISISLLLRDLPGQVFRNYEW